MKTVPFFTLTQFLSSNQKRTSTLLSSTTADLSVEVDLNSLMLASIAS
jgi:hypothetical protein